MKGNLGKNKNILSLVSNNRVINYIKVVFLFYILIFTQTVTAAVVTNNSSTTNISGATGSSQLYNIDIPAGATGFTITTSGNSGDADLYVKFGSAPTTSVYDLRSYSSGSNESISIATPSVGTYHIVIQGYSAYSGLTLNVSYTNATSPQAQPVTGGLSGNPATVSNLSGTINSETNFNIDIPSGASNLVIKIAGSTGDADLYVKFGAAPTLTVYDFRPFIGGSNETVTIATPSVGLYHIMIAGYSAYTGVSLTVNYTDGSGSVITIPSDPDGFLQFLNKSAPRNIENTSTGNAYYAAVDPNNKRLTLSDFKAFNNNLSDQPNAVYVNDADLGFGRRMYLSVNPKGSVSSCVENFAPLDASGKPNVNASASEKLALAHAGDPNVVIATVCMEYSGTPGSGASVETLTGRKYVKFFSYKAGGIRITQADLDGRGLKTQPGLCNTCHGGQGSTLVNGVYPNNGDTGAQFLPWDLDTFVYDTIAGSTRVDLEPILKRFNKGVLATYPQPQTFSFQGKSVIPKIPANAVVNGVVINPGILESSITVSGVSNLLTEFVISIDTDGQGGPGISFPFVQTLALELITPSGKVIGVRRGTTGIYDVAVTGIKNLYLADDAASVRANVTEVGPQIVNGNATGLSIGVSQGFVNNTECKSGIAVPKSAIDVGCINANGVWKLRISNYGTFYSGLGAIDPNMSGFLYGWSLHFNGIPDGAYLPAPVELIRGWYGGKKLPSSQFNGQYVPSGWKLANNSGAAANPEILYLDVIGPTCRACHAQRGTMGFNDIDFSSYAKFMSYSDRTASLIFDKGTMPLAKRTYENHFWNSTKPGILAQHLTGVGAARQPGRNIADAGIARIGNLAIRINDFVKLNGNGSLFPNAFNWTVIAPNGTTVALSGSTTATPSFTVTQVGLYRVTLDTSGNSAKTAATTSTTIVEGSVNAPGPISFIQQIIGDNSANAVIDPAAVKAMDSCTASRCHASNFRELDRVTYVTNSPASVADQNQDYRFIRDRVDTFLPLDSLTIQKGLEKLRHGSIGFSDVNLVTPWSDTGNQLNSKQYDLFLRWVLEGAPR